MIRKITILLMDLFILVGICIMVASATISTSYSYSWNKNTVELSAAITIGTWGTQAWSPTATYASGDKVIYNGIEYIALRTVPAGKVPGARGSQNFWQIVS